MAIYPFIQYLQVVYIFLFKAIIHLGVITACFYILSHFSTLKDEEKYPVKTLI